MGQKYSIVTTTSYPLPPDTTATEMDAGQLQRALEYVSRDLRRKHLNVHLIVGGPALSCLLFKSAPTWYAPPPSPETAHH